MGTGTVVAQGPVDGVVWGRLLDARGAAVGRVRVEVRSAEGVVERRFETGVDGTFLMLRLPPGTYGLRALRTDDAALIVESPVQVEAGETVEFVLRVGGPGSLHPTLTDDETGGEDGAPGIGGAEALPVEAREWESLGVLDSRANPAAVAGDAEEEDSGEKRTSDGSAAGGLSFAGLAAMEDGQTVDGVSSTQSFGGVPRGGGARGVGRLRASFGAGAVRSFRVLPRTFSAQYGGAASGLTAVVSRGGTAGWHGSAFYQVRGSAWGATNPFSVETHYRDGVVTSGLVKPGGWLNQFGGSVGLPLNGASVPSRVRGKMSVFGSLEQQVRVDKVVSSPALASFYTLTASQVDLLGNRGVTKAATNVALNYLDSLSGETERTATRGLEFLRVDLVQSERDRLTGTYARSRFNQPKGVALGQASDAVVARGTASLGDSMVHMDAGTGRWLHTFDATANNDLRGQVAHDLEFESPHVPLPQEPGIGPGGFAPQVSIAPDGFAYGTPSSLGRTAYPEEWRVELAEALQVVVGRHLVTMGAGWSRVQDRVATVTNAEGSFSYDSGVVHSGPTGAHDGGLPDWITDYTFNVNAYPNGGCPRATLTTPPAHYFCFRTFTQNFGGQQTQFVTHDLAGFVEDAFHVRKDLLLTVGARYDYTLLPLPQTPNRTLDGDLVGLGLPVTGSTSVFPEDRNNFGVRFAASWSPKDWLTARLGYGVFYGRIPGATVRAALANTALASTTLQVRIRPTVTVDCPQVTAVQQGFGYPCAFLGTPPAAVAETSSAEVFAARYRVPSVQRATLSVEREVGRRGFVRASYAMAVATQLPQSVDVNIAPATSEGSFVLQGGPASLEGKTFVVPSYTARRIVQYGAVTALVSNANATYHSGTLEARWAALGVEVRGSYTFSRAIDYGPQSSATPRLNGQFDPFRNGYDKGLSDLQFPQRFAGDMVWRVSEKRGPAWLRRGLDGWMVAAIATAGSGAPYSYEIFGGSYLSGGHESVNGAGGATYLPTIGRNTLRLPPRGNVDVRLAQGMMVGHLAGRDARLEGYAEAFNVLNARSFSRVETRAFLLGTPVAPGAATALVFQDAATIATEGLTTPAFGAPLSSTNGLNRERQVEVGVRLDF